MRLDRRDFGKLLVAGATGAVAGCGGGDGGNGGISEADLEGPVLTVLARVPAQGIRLNPFALSQRGTAVMEFLDQLVLPVVHPTGDPLTSGHAWSVDGTEVTVPCVVSGYELDVPDGITYTFDDRLAYWNGEALDARAYHIADRIRYLLNWKFDDSYSFRGELRSETTYRWTFPEGRNPMQMEQALFPGRPPLPPAFTESWLNKAEDASSQDRIDAIFEELSGVDVDFTTLAEEGYGTGAYAIESTEDVYANELLARAREEHPGDVPVEHLHVRFIGNRGMEAALSSGSIDLGNSIIAKQGGDLNRGALPEKIQQLGTFPTPRNGGMQLVFNWGNEHVRRLWVRRALVAAIPVRRAIRNAWGERWRPPSHHAGLLSRVDEAALGEAFLSNLHDYPFERDQETAANWLERAGYTKDGGRWHDPDGGLVSFRLLTFAGSSTQQTLAKTVRNALREFGFGIEVRRFRGADFESVLRDGQYELTFGGVPGGWSPIGGYEPELGVGRFGVGGSPLSIADNPLGTCGEASGPFSRPATVTIPGEPGALAIEGVTYGDGGTKYRHEGGTDVSICETTARLTATDIGESELHEALETCARWYNYAVPNLVFAQPRVGLFANTTAFSTPPTDSEATTVTRFWTTDPEDYHVQAGTIR